MATGTLTPWPRYTVLNAAGKPISGALLYTYIAGTSTPVATYTDVALLVPNSNPIVANSSGQIGPVFLAPGSSYKYVFQNPDGSGLFSQDNIAAGGGATNSDVIGTAGETLTAGQTVYLSDGSGGKTAGLWYKADAANAYSSTTPMLGMVQATIASAGTGAITLLGTITGLSSLTVGTTYYVGTSGAVTATAPANARFVGVADTTSSLVIAPDPPPQTVVVAQNTCQGRLTLTTGVPVTTADVLAATTLRFAPYAGNLIALYNGTNWQLFTFTELSIAVPATTNQMYDVFVFDSAGTRTLELLAWTNDTTRATALVTQDGVLCKSGALTRRYVGSCRTTGVSGQTEDSVLKRYVWNYYNRVARVLQRYETTATWNYTLATVRQANGSAANQVDIVVGVAEAPINLALIGVNVDNTGNQVDVSVGIGEDSTTTYAAGAFVQTIGNARNGLLTTTLVKYPAIGRHFYSWNEWSTATGTTAWRGAYASAGSNITSGLTGTVQG